MARVVIALGGNALGNDAREQKEKIDAAVPALIDLIEAGHEIILSHGNGPQVGAINLAFDIASAKEDKIPPMELAECTSMSQGYIGYHLQQGLYRELRRRHMPWQVVSVVTQVVVDENDPAFEKPTKPIGGFYDEASAKEMMRRDKTLKMKEDAGRGWRRLVASPKPQEIVEDQPIRTLLGHDYIVIACGGGGIPVVRRGGGLHGVAAVIDKDFASAKLAEVVDADYLMILTAVDHVMLHYGTAEEIELAHMSVSEAQAYIRAGEFAPGSMLPKVEAAIEFARSGNGRRAIIASLDRAADAIAGRSGTAISLVGAPDIAGSLR